MEMIKVRSTNLKAIGHEGDTLSIEFHSGAKYEYKPFSKDRFVEFYNSNSIGSYFKNEIAKDETLTYEKI